MNDGIKISVQGLPEFSQRLRALGADMERKVVRAGALAAGIVFRNAAKANAPVLKSPRKGRIAGALQKAIYASRVRPTPGLEHIVVAARAGGKTVKSSSAAYYWRWVEAGHVARGPGGKLKGGNRSRALQRQRLSAGGKIVPGVAFLKRAFQSQQGEAIKAFNNRIERRIQKAQKDLNVR